MATIIKGKNPNKPYTVRYRLDGRQRERSFRTNQEAKDFRLKFEHDSREQIFVDPRLAGEKFSKAAEAWIARRRAPASRRIYSFTLHNWVGPAFGDRTLAQVARDRDGLERFLRVTMPEAGLSLSRIKTAYVLIRGTVNDAIKAGRLSTTRLNGIPLPAESARAEFVFPASGQMAKLAAALPDGYRLAVWLMRGCGLRAGEALAVRQSDFMPGVLRLSAQMSADGRERMPLKARKPGDFRDLPVPAYVASLVAAQPVQPDGSLFAPLSRREFNRWFRAGADKAGLPKEFVPHSLRHVFASVALANGIPITDVSKWLGHRNINITFATYGHLVPSSWDSARKVLDREYAQWSKAA